MKAPPPSLPSLPLPGKHDVRGNFLRPRVFFFSFFRLFVCLCLFVDINVFIYVNKQSMMLKRFPPPSSQLSDNKVRASLEKEERKKKHCNSFACGDQLGLVTPVSSSRVLPRPFPAAPSRQDVTYPVTTSHAALLPLPPSPPPPPVLLHHVSK